MNFEREVTIGEIEIKRENIDAVIDRIKSDCEERHMEGSFGKGNWRDIVFIELASMFKLPFVEIDPDDPEFGCIPDKNDPRVQELRRQFDEFVRIDEILEDARI